MSIPSRWLAVVVVLALPALARTHGKPKSPKHRSHVTKQHHHHGHSAKKHSTHLTK